MLRSNVRDAHRSGHRRVGVREELMPRLHLDLALFSARE